MYTRQAKLVMLKNGGFFVNMKDNKEYIKWGITAFLVVLGGIISYYMIFHLDNLTARIAKLFIMLAPVIDGIVIGYLMTPVVNTIERKMVKPVFKKLNINQKKPQRRLVSILITLAIVISLIYAFFSLVIPQIGNSIATIIVQFPNYISTLEVWVSKLLDDNPVIAQNVTDIINNYFDDIEQFVNAKIVPRLNSLIMTISMSVYSILREFWNLIIGFIISIYILSSKELFAAQAKKSVYAFVPKEAANRLINNVRFANQTFGGFFVGKIVDSIIIGLICFAGTSIIGTPFSVLISVIIGVTNIIPFFGPFLGAIPSILLILFINPMQALYFLIFVIVLQQADGNIIGPKILGNSTGLSSFWVIFAITLFGGMWGVFGMIVGVPIFAVIFAFMKSLVELKLKNKELPTETSKYLRLLYIEPNTNRIVDFSEDAKRPFEKIDKILINNKGNNKNQKGNNNIKGVTNQNKDTGDDDLK